jgi:CubicO group peptidase (beta-lactamase class C family)
MCSFGLPGLFCTLAVLASSPLGLAVDLADRWPLLTAQLKVYGGLHDFAMTVGNASARQFSFERGNTTLGAKILMASASKFPAATAIAGAVADESVKLTFDTKASSVFEWWTDDTSDPRSGVTLRSLLSFTSGFYWTDADGSSAVPCLTPPLSLVTSPEKCAESIYKKAPFPFAAGSTFSYNSFHLQLAGAMAAKAAGITVVQLLDKYLIKKLGMTDTKWLIGQNPMLAAGMETTGDDYDKFLRAYLSYEHLPKAVADEMERDYCSAPYATNVANSSTFLAGYLGHYSMCNWYECLENFDQDDDGHHATFPDTCRDARIHMDAGLFGYYPLVDRPRGLYMQVVQAQLVPLTDLNATQTAIDLRLAAKPTVDWCMGQGPKPPPVQATPEAVARGARLRAHGGVCFASLRNAAARGANAGGIPAGVLRAAAALEEEEEEGGGEEQQKRS